MPLGRRLGAGQVRRYDADGRHVATIDIPAPQVSSVAFAGPDLRTLVITTSVQDLSPAELASHPDSGRLFTVELDIAGDASRSGRGAAEVRAFVITAPGEAGVHEVEAPVAGAARWSSTSSGSGSAEPMSSSSPARSAQPARATPSSPCGSATNGRVR